MFRLMFGMALGWLAATWYYNSRQSMGNQMSETTRSFSDRAKAAMEETRETVSELGQEAKTAAKMTKSRAKEETEEIQQAAKEGRRT